MEDYAERSRIRLRIRGLGSGTLPNVSPGGSGFIQKEDASYILQEDGSKILTET